MAENEGLLGRIGARVSGVMRDFLDEARRPFVEAQLQRGFASLDQEARRRDAEFGHLLNEDPILTALKQQHGATPEEIGNLHEAMMKRRAEIMWADDPPSVVQAAREQAASYTPPNS